MAAGALVACGSSTGNPESEFGPGATSMGTSTGSSTGTASGSSAASGSGAASGTSGLSFVRAGCQTPQAGDAPMVCFAWHSQGDTAADTTSDGLSPRGYGPADLVSAYNVPTTLAPGSTVAIVDAMDDPNAESDLAVYRAAFGLPACTTANGCFTKVSQSGGADLPAADTGWSIEIALDLDMVSATCPSCRIVLVEASSATADALGVAENTAASFGPVAISNSWGGGESPSEAEEDRLYFDHPGVFLAFSAGDDGFGTGYPATSANVTSVGGTSLTRASTSRGWSESAWSSGGSGCSKYIAKPSFQKDTGCKTRMAADVSAVGDPDTGVAFYATYGGSAAGATGWLVAGGTSVSAPVVAGIFARTSQAAVATNAFSYANPSAFYDVTSGHNGSCGTYECTAGVGYDGPTGNGSPNGAALAAALAAIDAGAGAGAGASASDAGAGSADAGGDASRDSGASSGTADAGSAGTPGGDAGSGAATDGGADGCSHDVCATGAKLTRLCDPCAHAICEADSYCCLAEWDAVCVGEVATVCEQRCE